MKSKIKNIKLKIILLIVLLLFGVTSGYLAVKRYVNHREQKIEKKKVESELLYENLQYNYSVILPGGWRTSELDTNGKVIALISPQAAKKVQSRTEILKSGGIILQPQVSGLSKPAELIAYRNDWEKYLQQSGVEFEVKSKKIGRYDSYIFTVKIPKNKADIVQEVHTFINTTPKILLQSLSFNKIIKDIVSRIEGSSKLFQDKKSKIDEINTFLGLINQKKYEDAYEKIDNKRLKSVQELKELVAGNEEWFGGATLWYSISTQNNQELYRGLIIKENEKHLVLVRVSIEGLITKIKEFSITPALQKGEN